MWDVVWTDPDKELVGEHRARKGRTREDKEKSSIRSGRDSASTSASNSSSETPLRFFRSRGAKGAVIQKPKGRNASSPLFSGLATPSLTSTLSPFSATFDSASRRSSGLITTAPNSPNKDDHEVLSSSIEQDAIPSFGSRLSMSIGGIGSTGAAHVPNSFSDSGVSDSPNIAALIQMLGESPPKGELPDIPRSVPQDLGIMSGSGEGGTEMPKISSLRAMTPLPSVKCSGLLCTSEASETPVVLTPPPKSSRRPTAALLGINDADTWRTPSEWRDHDVRKTHNTLKRATQKIGKDKAIKTEAFAISNSRQGVWSAAGAPTAMILARLKQVLEAEPDEEREPQPENSKQHWMLSLLHGLGYIADPNHEEECIVPAAPLASLVLLLYESPAYAAYLGTVHADTQVYHLTREGLTGNLPRNVQPLQAPPPEASCFPVAPRLFQTVYSYSLPSSCPYTDLRNVLGNIHKCLKPGGSLKLTIIDPLPCAETLGHRLRTWMDRHLFPNLEERSRSLEPSRLFPKLLGDAGLRSRGSRRTKVKFFALPESARGGDYHDPDPSIDRLYQNRKDKAEMRSLVGRMFWQSVWGQHLTPPNTWWWDDPACVEECRQLGTFWEYHIIDAVKAE